MLFRSVKHKEEQICFQELKERAKKLGAQIIQKTHHAMNLPVAVYLPKEINAVIADLGVLYSCNPFMNLDVKTPADRIGKILDLIRPCAIVTSVRFAAKLERTDVPLILMEEIVDEAEPKDFVLENRRKLLIDTDPICIINTSGSTGTPKGVVLNHRDRKSVV